jgi:hypothetical protein
VRQGLRATRGDVHKNVKLLQCAEISLKPLFSIQEGTAVRSPKGHFDSFNTVGCYEYCLARSLARQTSKTLGGRLVPFRLSISGLVAISLLTTILSFRYIHAASASARPSSDDTPGNPVLVELFTSEGCSSCPPADALLERLDRSQSVIGARLIVLSEHVDYWNGIGWRDPYSSHEYSERQSAYATQFGLAGIYTPQMVVDGHFEFVGSDEHRASQAIKEAARASKARVSISLGSSDGNAITVHVEAGPLPSSADTQSAGVFLAIADNSDESQVSGGENSGRKLQHVGVLRKLTRIGAVDGSAGFSRDINLDLKSRNHGNLRIVVIVQEAEVGRVLGAGLARLSN